VIVVASFPRVPPNNEMQQTRPGFARSLAADLSVGRAQERSRGRMPGRTKGGATSGDHWGMLAPADSVAPRR
jgi:hypothetical protein